MLLVVHNSHTDIYEADDFILGVLNKELRFPTALAQYQDEGIEVPTTEDGWDGWVRLLHICKTKPSWFPTGLLPLAVKIGEKFGYEVTVEDRRVQPPEAFPELVNIELRDYQREAVKQALDVGRGVLDMPPRSGKTRTMTEIVRSVALPTVWIAPTDRIVQQTRDVIKGFFGENHAIHLVGSSNYPDAMAYPVVVCTAATASGLPQEFYDSRDCIVVDEFHHCLSPTTQVLTDKGECSISKIKVGDLVWSQGLHGCALKPVINVWERRSPKKMLRVHTTVGILEVTSEHQIYTEAGKRKAKDFRTGDTVYVSRNRLSNLRQLREKHTQKIFWGTSYKLFGSKCLVKARSTRQSDAKKKSKSEIQKAVIRSYAGGQKSIQTQRCSRKNKSKLEKHGQGTLWSRLWGKGLSSYRYRRVGSWDFITPGICSGIQNINRRKKGSRKGYLVFSGFCSYTKKDSGRNRRVQSQKSKRSRRQKRRIFSSPGLVSISSFNKIYTRSINLDKSRIIKIEEIQASSERVFDLGVAGNHNYIANGVLVSNSAAKSYKNIFDRCDHIYYRYGMTGTFFRSGEDILSMHALLSTTIYKVSSMELLRRGYLVPTYVAFMPVIAPLLRNMDSTFQKGHGKHGIQEHVGRNQLVSHCALELFKTGRKVLILVGTKKQGRLIRDILLAFMPGSPEKAEFKSVEFVSTDTDRPKQGRILESFELGQEVKVLIGTSLLGEGVDLPSTDALVYARGEQAQVGLTQSIYRVCTAVEGKKNAIVIDFADRHNRKLMIHSKERLRVYYNEETFQVSVLQTVKDLNKWLGDVLLLGG